MAKSKKDSKPYSITKNTEIPQGISKTYGAVEKKKPSASTNTSSGSKQKKDAPSLAEQATKKLNNAKGK